MMEYYELIKTWTFTGSIGIWTYWVPLLLCAIGYTGKTIRQVRDIKTYTKHERYVEDLTLGQVIWRVLASITPIVNIMTLTFSLGWGMLSTVASWVNDMFNFKLVKKST